MPRSAERFMTRCLPFATARRTAAAPPVAEYHFNRSRKIPDRWRYVDKAERPALYRQGRQARLRAFQISSTGQRRAHSGVASL